MPGAGYVFSYVNPDTDGVACSIGYSFLRRVRDGADFQPLVWGDINAETKLVLDHFQITPPAQGHELPPDADLVLVDCHHPPQLASEVDLPRVVEIIDHHPAGAPEAFPNALVQNEQVGAAATLITERIINDQIQPYPAVAGLLAAAIVSNTYNFAAPSTTDRDRRALDWLTQRCNFDPALPGKMLAALSSFDEQGTHDLMVQNYKAFVLNSCSIGIVQIETTMPTGVLDRSDLLPTLSALRAQELVQHLVLSVIDLAAAQTYLVTDLSESRELLENALDVSFVHGRAAAPRIMMRKTDLVPGLSAHLENLDQGR